MSDPGWVFDIRGSVFLDVDRRLRVAGTFEVEDVGFGVGRWKGTTRVEVRAILEEWEDAGSYGLGVVVSCDGRRPMMRPPDRDLESSGWGRAAPSAHGGRDPSGWPWVSCVSKLPRPAPR